MALALFAVGKLAAATECGDLRLQQANLKAATTVEEQLAASIADATGKKHQAAAKDAAAQAKALDKKIATVCAPRTVTIAALPIAYLSVAPGAGSRTAIDFDRFALTFTTLAGAGGGLTFPDPVTLPAPSDMRLDSDAHKKELAEEPSGILVIAATDAQLTVEEPAPGRGAWRLEWRGKPIVAPLSRLAACAAASTSQEVGGVKLAPSACQTLLRAAPLGPTHAAAAVPERGRAIRLGEWQFGNGAGLELLDELAEVATAAGPAPRLDLTLDLSAPLPNVSDGKKLAVSLGANKRPSAAGAALKLANECGEDAKCKGRWFAAEIWLDRVFAVPLLRPRPTSTSKVVGRIADRLEKPIAGQRVLAASGDRRVVTVTDADGKYRFEGLSAGDWTFSITSKHSANRPPRDAALRAALPLTGGDGPKIHADKLFE
jgi:Carboxypeptidase regulatory-like domain